MSDDNTTTTALDLLLGTAALALLGGTVYAARRAAVATGAGLLGSFGEDEDGEGRDFKLRGEWWIDDSGQAMYADGDVGDMNHEAHVIQGLTWQILNALNIEDDGEFVSLDDHEDDIRQALVEEGLPEDATPQQVEAALIEAVRHGFPAEGQVEAAFRAVNGTSDARDYALKYTGWVRVKGNSIQTWTLTARDLNNIASGLADADDEIPDGALFDIEVSSNQKFYQNVPMSVIEKGNPAALRPYLFVGW